MTQSSKIEKPSKVIQLFRILPNFSLHDGPSQVAGTITCLLYCRHAALTALSKRLL
jgi:hypothetical protein